MKNKLCLIVGLEKPTARQTGFDFFTVYTEIGVWEGPLMESHEKCQFIWPEDAEGLRLRGLRLSFTGTGDRSTFFDGTVAYYNVFKADLKDVERMMKTLKKINVGMTERETKYGSTYDNPVERIMRFADVLKIDTAFVLDTQEWEELPSHLKKGYQRHDGVDSIRWMLQRVFALSLKRFGKKPEVEA